MRLHPRPQRRPAAALVEFAVVVPLLLMFMLGIIEYGRMLQVANVTTNASREGARFAVQSDTTVSAVGQYTRDYLAAAGIPNAAVTEVAVEQLGSNNSWAAVSDLKAVKSGTPVRVRVNVNFAAVTWLPSGFMVPSGTVMNGVSVMRKE